MKKFSKIMAPFSGTPPDEQAIRLACQIARQDKAQVLAIYVIEVQRTLALDTENSPQIEFGEVLLAQADKLIRESGIRPETELLQARVAGPALVDEAIARGVDLIVMGVPYRKPLGDFSLGATASYVIKNAPCPVWVCREAATEDRRTSRKK